MNAIITTLADIGIRCQLIDGRLNLTPSRLVTDEVKELVKTNREAIITALTQAETVTDQTANGHLSQPVTMNDQQRDTIMLSVSTQKIPEQTEPETITTLTRAEGDINILDAGADPATTLPTWCQTGCPCLEIIPEVGPGCIRALEDGLYREEWRALSTTTECFATEPPTNPSMQAMGYGCGRCGNKVYTQVGGGWLCDGCGMIFEVIGGSRGPRPLSTLMQ